MSRLSINVRIVAVRFIAVSLLVNSLPADQELIPPLKDTASKEVSNRTEVTLPGEQAETLRMLAARTQANQALIHTLSGTYRCVDVRQLSGAGLAHRLQIPNPDPGNDGTEWSFQQESTIAFVVNRDTGSLYNDCEVTQITVRKASGALDELKLPELKKFHQRSYVTDNEYVQFDPDFIHGDLIVTAEARRKDPVGFEGIPAEGRAAYRKPLSEADSRQIGRLIDPLRLFDYSTPFTRMLPMLADSLEQEPPIDPDLPIDVDVLRRALQVYRDGLRIRRFTYADGRETIQVEFPALGGPEINETLRSQFTFDSRCSFLPTSGGFVGPDGVRFASIVWHYRKLDGMFLPAHVARFSHRDESKIDSQRILSLQSVALNPPVAEDQFTLAGLGLEEGERLFDEERNKAYLYQGGELVEVASSMLQASRYSLLLIVNIIALLAIAASFYYLGWSRGRSPKVSSP